MDVGAVEREAEEVRGLLAGLTNDDGWMLSRDDEMRVLYKHEVGGRRYCCWSLLVCRHSLHEPVAHVAPQDG